MTERVCPGCGETFYSADTLTPWVCQKCGCGIPVDHQDKKNNENKTKEDTTNA